MADAPKPQPQPPKNEDYNPEDSPGARMAAIRQDPTQSLEETRNAAAGKAPSGAGGSMPSTVDTHIPSTNNPQATDLPTGSGTTLNPEEANPAVNPNAAKEKSSGTSG